MVVRKCTASQPKPVQCAYKVTKRVAGSEVLRAPAAMLLEVNSKEGKGEVP